MISINGPNDGQHYANFRNGDDQIMENIWRYDEMIVFLC